MITIEIVHHTNQSLTVAILSNYKRWFSYVQLAITLHSGMRHVDEGIRPGVDDFKICLNSGFR